MKDSKASDKKNNSAPVLVRAAVFVLVFILFITSFTYILRRGGDTKDRFMGFYAEPGDSLDIVMIGSSPTYSSCVMPELYGEYGIKAYPLASNVQRPVAGMYLVKEAEKTQSPKLYMFEMRMYVGIQVGLTDNMAYTREVTDNMKYSFNRIAAINAMVTDDIERDDTDRYTYYFDIFKYHSNWPSLVDPDQWASFRFTRPDPYKGYKITDKVGPIENPGPPADEPAQVLDPYQEKALTDLIAYLKKTGAEALFYVAPYEMQEGDAGKYAHIRETVEAAGFSFLDMNGYYDELDLDFQRDFSDYGIHTNAVGARKCTKFLGEYLTEHYDLPDHRKDNAGNESWDRAYENWLAEYEQAEQNIDKRIKEKDFFVIEE